MVYWVNTYRVPVRNLREFLTLGKAMREYTKELGKEAVIAHRLDGPMGTIVASVKFKDMMEAEEFSGQLRQDPKFMEMVGKGAALCEQNPERSFYSEI